MSKGFILYDMNYLELIMISSVSIRIALWDLMCHYPKTMIKIDHYTALNKQANRNFNDLCKEKKIIC